MPLYLMPLSTSPIIDNPFWKKFQGEAMPFSGATFQRLSDKAKRPSRQKNMVLICFQHAPFSKQYRWDKKWWKKINFKAGVRDGHEFEMPPEELVGVYLKDLNEFEKDKIVKKERFVKE